MAVNIAEVYQTEKRETQPQLPKRLLDSENSVSPPQFPSRSVPSTSKFRSGTAIGSV